MEDVNLTSNHTNDIGNKAVMIIDAYKAYSSSIVVLNGFNMNVEKGTIYGLLGPSGCGKTTLLSCIIGQSRLDAGHIKLSINKKKDIGYMPQELALYNEFNILETLHYFGLLYEMCYEDIISKGEKLMKIMELSSVKTQFGSLSGGQQRRFSLCVTLLHEPSLLILDEPTVGLDPIISASIWEYIKDLANCGKTIIITTHYIEEARQANTIGLMRKGVLLSEASPVEIMTSCNVDTLESAFLILSQNHNAVNTNMDVYRKKCIHPSTTTIEKSSFFEYTRFKAQMLKNWYWSIRNWEIIFFICFLPIFTVLIFNITIGRTPSYLQIGIVNNEIPSPCPYESNNICDNTIPLSCKYIHEIENQGLSLKYYNDVKLAEEDSIRGHTWGFMQFKQNFTDMIKVRFDDAMDMSVDDLEKSSISIRMDMSDFVISKLIEGKLLLSYRDLAINFKSCNKNSSVVSIIRTLPFKIMQPVHGSFNINIVFYGSAAIISILGLYSTFLFTALSINMDINSGMIERSLASGLSISEIFLSQFLLQFVIMLFQIGSMFILQFVVFKHPFLSSPIWPFALVLLQGICGTFLGFATSVTFDERLTTFIGICLVMSQVFLGGIMWPLESMHSILKTITVFLPLTLSIEALRSMNARNWDIFHPTVMHGFQSILGWILFSITITILSLKFKSVIKRTK
ncbi:Hypothetical protein CINCED_3A007510 [Cinara cedri]|uniref:ABC transporter domain-containing protein n=1 Tax=Cinara cedri TaxID=506608 RepID=A0A5E4M0R6_9HEMI|nr:Hypothetical protein CINCED_3A007510 [Cinara cedri]